MTIDEAIAVIEKREKCKNENDSCLGKKCEECECDYDSEGFELLLEGEMTEWLEELKDYRDKNKIVIKIDALNTKGLLDATIEKAKEYYKQGRADNQKEIIAKCKELEAYNVTRYGAPTVEAYSDAFADFVEWLEKEIKAYEE